MSQVVEVGVVVQGLAALIQAIAEAGLQHQEGGEVVAADGRRRAVDLVVTDEAGIQVGVTVDQRTGTATFIGHDRQDRRASALANRIAQRYAYSRTLEELRRKGYQIAREETQQDGTIKLVAQRWR